MARACGVALSAPRSGRAAAHRGPTANRRNLRNLVHVKERVKHHVAERHVDDRILAPLRENLPHFTHPVLPRVRAPRIVHPEKSALEHVVAQRLGLFGLEVRAAELAHHDERAIEQLGIGGHDHVVVRRAGLVEVDRRLGELRQPDGEILIGARVIHAPAAAVAVVGLAIRQPAEREVAGEAVRVGPAGRRLIAVTSAAAPPTAAAKALRCTPLPLSPSPR